jgi:hypothetical protein
MTADIDTGYDHTTRSETEVKITKTDPGREPATPMNDQG